MKKIIAIVLVVLCAGCAKTYTVEEVNSRVKTIVDAVNETYFIASTTAKEVFKKQLAKCEAESKTLDLKTLECVESLENKS